MSFEFPYHAQTDGPNRLMLTDLSQALQTRFDQPLAQDLFHFLLAFSRRYTLELVKQDSVLCLRGRQAAEYRGTREFALTFERNARMYPTPSPRPELDEGPLSAEQTLALHQALHRASGWALEPAQIRMLGAVMEGESHELRNHHEVFTALSHRTGHRLLGQRVRIVYAGDFQLTLSVQTQYPQPTTESHPF